MGKVYAWEFPLPRTHTGMLQGNGTLGAMIWGGCRMLRITLGRADFWDHRGGLGWNPRMTYADIRRLLEAGDQKALGELCQCPPPPEGEPVKPTILPLGRFDFDFGPQARLVKGTLDLNDGTATVLVDQAGATHSLQIVHDMSNPVICVRLPEALAAVQVKCVPAWEYVGERLQSLSFQPPEMFEARGLTGWVQDRPADPPVCVAAARVDSELRLTAVYGDDGDEARREAADIAAAPGSSFDVIQENNRTWWKDYWAHVPKVSTPNADVNFLHDYGMYKFASLTNPDVVPATLQGPWIEEYQMPPWSSDYHFNINVQMCYWPAYHGNRLANLKPLFDMVTSWSDRLRENARLFLGIDDGLMLPHAVDDRGTCMGDFWCGTIDHGCTAWVAQMMFRYYRYSGDEAFLRETAYPFMVGAMRVYEEMLEEQDDAYVLPISVSPEYFAKSGQAWGRSASFQLACIHRLCEDLVDAAQVLGVEPRAIWATSWTSCPRPAWWASRDTKRSACGKDWCSRKATATTRTWRASRPSTSSTWPTRHGRHSRAIDRPMGREGPGLWSGWCVPWAVMLQTRFGNADAAELLLQWWQRVFTNEGHGTLHDVNISGSSMMGRGATTGRTRSAEIMQIEAGMSATTAIQEMLLHTRRGVNVLFAGAPRRWKKVSFTSMRTDGAFLVSSERRDGVVQFVKVKSEVGGTFRLANPWDGPAEVTCGKQSRTVSGDVLEIPMKRRQTVRVAPM